MFGMNLNLSSVKSVSKLYNAATDSWHDNTIPGQQRKASAQQETKPPKAEQQKIEQPRRPWTENDRYEERREEYQGSQYGVSLVKRTFLDGRVTMHVEVASPSDKAWAEFQEKFLAARETPFDVNVAIFKAAEISWEPPKADFSDCAWETESDSDHEADVADGKRADGKSRKDVVFSA